MFIGPAERLGEGLINLSCKPTNVLMSSGSHVPTTYDMNNNKRQSNSRKERNRYQRVLSYKNMKHSKTIQSKPTSKLVNKGKIQSDDLNVMRQQFLDDVSVGILKFYRAAAKVTGTRYQKSTDISYQNNTINNQSNLKNNDKDQEKINRDIMKNKKEDETLQGEIFYSMKPEEFLPYYTHDVVSMYLFIKRLCVRVEIHYLYHTMLVTLTKNDVRMRQIRLIFIP